MQNSMASSEEPRKINIIMFKVFLNSMASSQDPVHQISKISPKKSRSQMNKGKKEANAIGAKTLSNAKMPNLLLFKSPYTSIRYSVGALYRRKKSRDP